MPHPQPVEVFRWFPRNMGRTARLMRFRAEHPECVDAANIVRNNPRHLLHGLAPDMMPIMASLNPDILEY